MTYSDMMSIKPKKDRHSRQQQTQTQTQQMEQQGDQVATHRRVINKHIYEVFRKDRMVTDAYLAQLRHNLSQRSAFINEVNVTTLLQRSSKLNQDAFSLLPEDLLLHRLRDGSAMTQVSHVSCVTCRVWCVMCRVSCHAQALDLITLLTRR